MDALYLQIETDLDSWLGAAAVYVQPAAKLEDLWVNSRIPSPGLNDFMPFGADYLIRQLQSNSPFKDYLEVQALDLSRFVPATGDLTRVRDLWTFLQSFGARPPKFVRLFVDEVFDWLDRPVEFGNGSAFSDLWNVINPGIGFADYGADKLVGQFKTSATFGPCPRVQILTASYFTVGGLKDVKSFRSHIKVCPLPPTL